MAESRRLFVLRITSLDVCFVPKAGGRITTLDRPLSSDEVHRPEGQ